MDTFLAEWEHLIFPDKCVYTIIIIVIIFYSGLILLLSA